MNVIRSEDEIEALVRRLQERVRIVDEPPGPVFRGDAQPWKFCMHPPTTEHHVREAQRRLGFDLPPLLRRVLLEVGNGHCGHHDGLLPLSPTSMADAFDSTIMELHELTNSQPEVLCDGRWPKDVPPIWEWGGGIFSCLDLGSASRIDPQVLRSEPNYATVVPRFRPHRPELPPFLLNEGMSFSEWLGAWLDNVNLTARPYETYE
jgi:hypothetical protein